MKGKKSKEKDRARQNVSWRQSAKENKNALYGTEKAWLLIFVYSERNIGQRS